MSQRRSAPREQSPCPWGHPGRGCLAGLQLGCSPHVAALLRALAYPSLKSQGRDGRRTAAFQLRRHCRVGVLIPGKAEGDRRGFGYGCVSWRRQIAGQWSPLAGPCLSDRAPAKSVTTIQQAKYQSGAYAFPPGMKREESTWTHKDQNAFSAEIKFYCVISAAPVI